jgi:hypothetical protein
LCEQAKNKKEEEEEKDGTDVATTSLVPFLALPRNSWQSLPVVYIWQSQTYKMKCFDV